MADPRVHLTVDVSDFRRGMAQAGRSIHDLLDDEPDEEA